MRTAFFLYLILLCATGSSQTLGGNAVYNFLKLPSSALLSSYGGVNVSFPYGDVGLAMNNPALLGPTHDGKISVAFNSLFGEVKTYTAAGAFHSQRLNTTFGGQIYFVDYGSVAQTDAAGNVSGTFRPVDFSVQASASRSYLEKWQYGGSVKFIQSSYQQFKSSGLAVDFGLHYSDTVHRFYAGLLAKNMGVQITSYVGQPEDLPFDVQLGVSKRLSKAPFAFSVSAQHLQRFDILYDDDAFNSANDQSIRNNFANKLFNHFVVAGHIFIGANLEAALGYNRLRRQELNIGNTANGFNGFSIGLRLKFQKLEVAYSRANYQRNIAYNHFGLTIDLKKLLGKNEL